MTTGRLLLVCGAAEDAELWDAVIAVAPGPVAVVELPPLDAPAALADHVAPLVQAPDVVIGHSLGGAVAAILAERGVAAAGWVLVACGSALPVHDTVWARLDAEGPAAVAQQLATAAAGGDGALARRTAAMFARRASALPAHLAACDAVRIPDRRIAGIEVVGGARDRMVAPALTRDLAERTGGHLTVLADAAHQLPWEAPDALLAAAGRLSP